MKPESKKLCECKQGDWVYYEYGELGQVQVEIFDDDKPYYSISNGIIKTGLGPDHMVYPLSLYTKTLADQIRYYYDEMHRHKVINGSRWTNWLSSMFDKLMLLDPDTADRSDYSQIWDEIEKTTSHLYSVRDQITNLEKELKY